MGAELELSREATTYEHTLRLGTIVVAEHIVEAVPLTDGFTREEREARRARMRRALQRLRGELATDDRTPAATWAKAFDRVPEEDRLAALVDLHFVEPFSPYLIRCEPQTKSDAVSALGAKLHLADSRLRELESAARRARATHNLVQDNRAMITAGAVAGLTVGAALLTHGAILPFVGHAHGLAGGAAMVHGLNVISAGHGIAGGVWVISTASGLAANERQRLIRTLMTQAGAASVRAELMKSQTFILSTPDERTKRLREFKSVLTDWDKAVREDLELEETLNDPGAPRIKDRKAALKAIERAATWATYPTRETTRDAAARAAEDVGARAKGAEIAMREAWRVVRRRVADAARDLPEQLDRISEQVDRADQEKRAT